MKKILLAAIIVLMSSCSKTTDVPSLLIKEDMKNTLVNPDSYRALDTKTDSAFSPEDDPLLFSKLMDYARDTIAIESLTDAIKKMQKEMESAGTAIGMSKISKVTGEEYEKLQTYYEACDVQVNILKTKHDSIKSSLNDRLSEIKEMLSKPRNFIGFKSIHHYKAENKDDEVKTDSCYYLFDKEMKETIYSVPLSVYRLMNEMINSLE